MNVAEYSSTQAKPREIEELSIEEPIEYVPVEVALKTIVTLRQDIENMNAEIEKTCPVCLEVYDVGTSSHKIIHNQHKVCIDCYKGWVEKTKTCPLCRKIIC